MPLYYISYRLCVHHMSQTDDFDCFDEENNLIFQFLLETCEKSLIPLSLVGKQEKTKKSDLLYKH